MLILAKLFSGHIFYFDLLDDMFIYKVKKIRYLVSREVRCLPQNIIVFKGENQIDDEEILAEGEYNVFINLLG